ncbi:MAG: T9SS type A sorting domain-containing protein [Ignavibacteria bacterium]|nr:T9SS type A sorting domain-containing protein [Ignavibacteria bacterium]
MSSSSSAQYTQAWIREYNGPANGNDEALVHCTDKSGNVFVAGSSAGVMSGLDIYLSKISGGGNVLWEYRYAGAGNGNDVPVDIETDAAGNVFVAGETASQVNGKDIVTLKFSSGGILLWERIYDGSSNDNDACAGLCIDAAGNSTVLGSVYSDSSSFDFATFRYSPAGDLMWSSTYDGPGGSIDFAGDITCDSAGNVFVTGGSFGNGTQNDFALLKYGPSGNELWVRRYNGPANANDNFTSVAVDPAGNAAVSGLSVGTGTGIDYATVKYSSSGDLAWVRRYTGPSNSSPDEFRAICADSQGNFYVTGSSVGQNTSYDFATVKYSPEGNEEWVARYNGSGNMSFDDPRSLCTDGDGNVFVAGLSGTSTLSDDLIVIKYSPAGEQTWFLRFNSVTNGMDEANHISTDAAGGIVVSGSTYTTVSSANVLVMKYSALTGTVVSGIEAPSEIEILPNYPNPFNSGTVVRLIVPKETAGSGKLFGLNVYSTDGRLLRTEFMGTLNSGLNEFRFNAEGLPGGIYFCTVFSGEVNYGTVRLNYLK